MPVISHYPFWCPSDNAYAQWLVFQRRRMELLQLSTPPWEATRCVRTPLSFTCGRYFRCYSRYLKVETEVPLYVGLYILFKLMIHQFPVHLLLCIRKSSDITYRLLLFLGGFGLTLISGWLALWSCTIGPRVFLLQSALPTVVRPPFQISTVIDFKFTLHEWSVSIN